MRVTHTRCRAVLALSAAIVLSAFSGSCADEPPPPPDEAATAGSISVAADDSCAAEIAVLKEQIRLLQVRVDQLEHKAPSAETATSPKETPAAPEPGEPSLPEAPEEGTNEPASGGAGRTLLLPDISLIGMFSTHVSNDRRDGDRARFFLEATELGVQSYVYPGVKADVFIPMPHEDENKARVEEAYLTLLHPAPRLSMRIGKTKAPFGRVNQLHKHSWLYVTPPPVLANLVGPESLAGEGIAASYLLPTGGGVFAQLDAGLWNSPEEPGYPETDPAAMLDTDIIQPTGAGFKDRFGTARLWASVDVGGNSEFELGASHARGRGVTPPWLSSAAEPQIRLTGFDASYRRFQGNNKRLLLRGEYYTHSNDILSAGRTARGYYLLADQRLSAYREYALRYDWSQYPFMTGLHQSGLSAIMTSQLTEQTYVRLQLTRGSRAGKRNVNEAWLQWVWGMGPHTHELE